MSNSKYKVKNFITIVYNSPKSPRKAMGFLFKNTIITALELTSSWIKFSYKNTVAYISLYSLEKILGSISINYIDSSKNKISESVVHDNLELGTHTYSAKIIEGYSLKTTSIISIEITKDEPNKTIIFEYIKEKPPLEGNAINEVPYISTYYIKPVVKPNEEVIIDYYITDYYHVEYLEDDFSHNFTVTVKTDGKTDVVIRNLKAGNHSVNLGSFSTEDEINFSILCTDEYGRNSHELFNFFLVQNDIIIKEYIMTKADLKEYNIKNNDNYEEKIYVKVDKLENTTSNTLIEETANKTSIPSKKYICFIGTTEE